MSASHRGHSSLWTDKWKSLMFAIGSNVTLWAIAISILVRSYGDNHCQHEDIKRSFSASEGWYVAAAWITVIYTTFYLIVMLIATFKPEFLNGTPLRNMTMFEQKNPTVGSVMVTIIDFLAFIAIFIMVGLLFATSGWERDESSATVNSDGDTVYDVSHTNGMHKCFATHFFDFNAPLALIVFPFITQVFFLRFIATADDHKAAIEDAKSR